MQENIECIEIIFKGIVQGVFFRRAVKEYATELNVYGFTKNLPDGSVLVIALATKGFLEKFINKILKKPGTGRVFRACRALIYPGFGGRFFVPGTGQILGKGCP